MNQFLMGAKKTLTSVRDILGKYKLEDRDKYISREFQKYGYELAEELGDLKNKSLYIKLAKETPRGLLESARSFVKDANNARSKARLYMWKLKELKTNNLKLKTITKNPLTK